jgi:predicted dithiol-disulfide oxidoreductase (DUF899 family)
MPLPQVVSAADWQAAHKRLLAKEKEATHARDALAAERRRQPVVRIDKDYVFEGPEGDASLVDLFEGRRQLILYHFMFAPDVDGWPKAGCPGCSMVLDQICNLAHLNARDTTFVAVSRAPLANLLAYRKRMGWSVPWYSSAGSDFNRDFGVTTDKGETFGLSVLLREGDDVYRSYFTAGRGVETLGPVWTLLDVTPLGRQETWEDSPPDWPQGEPYEWWRRHDEYAEAVIGPKPAARRASRTASRSASRGEVRGEARSQARGRGAARTARAQRKPAAKAARRGAGTRRASGARSPAKKRVARRT